MNHYSLKAFKMMSAARPASGFRPETEQEWRKLQRAHEEMLYAVLRDGGISSKEARLIAKEIFGSAESRFLLDLAFTDNNDE